MSDQPTSDTCVVAAVVAVADVAEQLSGAFLAVDADRSATGKRLRGMFEPTRGPSQEPYPFHAAEP